MDSSELRRLERDRKSLEAAANAILRADAERLGIEYGTYCKDRGIFGPAQHRRVKRHEVPLKDEND